MSYWKVPGKSNISAQHCWHAMNVGGSSDLITKLAFCHIHYIPTVSIHPCRTGNEDVLMALLTPFNVNYHARDGRKVMLLTTHNN